MIPFTRILNYGNIIRVVNIIDIQVSRTHTLALDEEGNLWGRGTNTTNILNQSTPLASTSSFVLVDTNVTKMFCGYVLTMYVKDGVLYRLGNAMTWDVGSAITPTKVEVPFDPKNIKKICCVSTTSIMILLNDGTIYFKGAGTNGRFGNGSVGAVNTWTLSTMNDVKDLYHCISLSEGSSAFTIALKNDGTVWGTGSIALNTSFNTFRFGSYISTTTWFQRTIDSNIDAIAASSGASALFLDKDGILYGDGNNNGELSGTATAGVYNNVTISSGVKLFGLNHESSYYVLKDTPTILNAGGRNFNLSSSFTSSGTYVGRTNTDLGEAINAIYTTRGVDAGLGIQYIQLQQQNVIIGGNSAAYQLGVNTGNINLQKSVLTGVGN